MVEVVYEIGIENEEGTVKAVVEVAGFFVAHTHAVYLLQQFSGLAGLDVAQDHFAESFEFSDVECAHVEKQTQVGFAVLVGVGQLLVEAFEEEVLLAELEAALVEFFVLLVDEGCHAEQHEEKKTYADERILRRSGALVYLRLVSGHDAR